MSYKLDMNKLEKLYLDPYNSQNPCSRLREVKSVLKEDL